MKVKLIMESAGRLVDIHAVVEINGVEKTTPKQDYNDPFFDATKIKTVEFDSDDKISVIKLITEHRIPTETLIEINKDVMKLFQEEIDKEFDNPFKNLNKLV